MGSNCTCESSCSPLQMERKKQEKKDKKQLQSDANKQLINDNIKNTDAKNYEEEEKVKESETSTITPSQVTNESKEPDATSIFENENDDDFESDFEIDEDDQDTVAEIKPNPNVYNTNPSPIKFKRKTSSKLDLPLTFEEIKKYVAEDRTGEFKRDPKYDQLYEKHKVNTKTKYGSIYDKIQIVEMEYPSKMREDGKLIVIREEGDEKTVFADNLFPYFIEEDISHDLVFSTFKDGISDEEVDEFLKEHIDHDKYDVFWYENPPHMKSLPLLWHVQVFSRPKRNLEDLP